MKQKILFQGKAAVYHNNKISKKEQKNKRKAQIAPNF
jgi:hypothetical protein